MPNYRVELKPSARKELERLPNATLNRAIERLESLSLDPRPRGCKKLVGGDREWRIRIADYRIIYSIDDDRRLVSVTRIRHRREVYEN